MAYYGFTRKIRDAIIAGLQDCGEQIFLTSQVLVPVDKGTLKKSGRTRRLATGFQIAYRTPYAAAVEFGFKRHSERVRKHWVRPHYRKFHHIRSILNLKTGHRQTHFLKARMRKGMKTYRLVPVDIKVRMKNKIYVSGHNRGPFTRPDVMGRVGERYLQDAIANHLGDAHLYIQKRL